MRNMWGKCMCKHLNHAPPLACEIGQKTLQARCKPNASYASLSCQRLKSFDTQVWILGGGPYVHITTSMWGHCEEHVKQCEEHVRWVWGTSEDNVRGSVRNMWGVGNLTTLSFNHRKIVKINQMMGGRRVCRYILKIFHACLHSSSLPLDLVNCLKISASQLQARHKPI